MSYDLMVFAPEAAPADREAFMVWYDEQTRWAEDHSYNDPAVTTPALRAWFLEIIKVYPAMNGPYSSYDLPEDEASLTDYSVGRSVIYAAFAWSKVEPAYEVMFRLAAKYGVGFFNVSAKTGDIWRPDGKRALLLVRS